jgi:hypothetical protein
MLDDLKKLNDLQQKVDSILPDQQRNPQKQKIRTRNLEGDFPMTNQPIYHIDKCRQI